MKLNVQTPKQSLNKAFLKQPVNRDEINAFKTNLQASVGSIHTRQTSFRSHFDDEGVLDTMLVAVS